MNILFNHKDKVNILISRNKNISFTANHAVFPRLTAMSAV